MNPGPRTNVSGIFTKKPGTDSTEPAGASSRRTGLGGKRDWEHCSAATSSGDSVRPSGPKWKANIVGVGAVVTSVWWMPSACPSSWAATASVSKSDPSVSQLEALLKVMSDSTITCPDWSTSAVNARQVPTQPLPFAQTSVFWPSVVKPAPVVPE